MGIGQGSKFSVYERLGPSLREIHENDGYPEVTIEDALKVGISLLTTIQTIHEQGYVHCDVKTDNLLAGRDLPPQENGIAL